MCFCGSGAAQPVPSGWMAAAGLHRGRGYDHKSCFFALSTSVVRQRPRRRPACVPLQSSYSSPLQLLCTRSTAPRSRCSPPSRPTCSLEALPEQLRMRSSAALLTHNSNQHDHDRESMSCGTRSLHRDFHGEGPPSNATTKEM